MRWWGAPARLPGARAPGPDWGWRIVLEASRDGGLRLLMYNRTPESEEVPAVEAICARR
jgi:hypothetical protein